MNNFPYFTTCEKSELGAVFCVLGMFLQESPCLCVFAGLGVIEFLCRNMLRYRKQEFGFFGYSMLEEGPKIGVKKRTATGVPVHADED